MSISIVMLAVGVVGAFFIYKMISTLILHFVSKKWILQIISKGIGLIFGGTYLYFAGYYIMDKETTGTMGFIVGLIPWVIYLAWKIFTKEKLIED